MDHFTSCFDSQTFFITIDVAVPPNCQMPRAPTDCLQWFTGSTGTVYSYNHQGGQVIPPKIFFVESFGRKLFGRATPLQQRGLFYFNRILSPNHGCHSSLARWNNSGMIMVVTVFERDGIKYNNSCHSSLAGWNNNGFHSS